MSWILPAAFVSAIALGWVTSYLARTGKFRKDGF